MDEHELENKGKAQEFNFRDYWLVLLKRKWTVVAFALPLFVIVTIYSFVKQPSYTAMGTLLIEKETNILTFEQVFQIETYMDDYFQTQFKLLQSRSLANNVIEKMKLAENAPDAKSRTRLIDNFLEKLAIKPIAQTRLVEVHFTDQSPQFAADVVNALFDSFIDMSAELKYATSEQASEFLAKQITELRSKIESRQREMQKYGAEKNIIALSSTETTIIEKLGELNRALTAAQIDRLKKEAYYNEVKNATPDNIPKEMSNDLIEKLREDYVRMNQEYSTKAETFKEDYPEMQRLRAELDSAKSLLEEETNNLIKAAYSDYQAALKREWSLAAAFDRQKEEAFQLNSNAIAYNSLRIEIENQNSLLESLIKRQSETGVAASMRGLRTSNIRIVDKAEVPLWPSSPKKKLNMILALLMGLFGGVGLAFLFERLDNSVKNHEDVEKTTGMAALGIVPAFSQDGFSKEPADEAPEINSIELITHLSPNSNMAESYRTIRTSLLLSSPEKKPRAIMLTSALPEEGKSSTLSNLAVTLAQAGKTVLVIDSDFRRPTQHKIFKVKNINGLTNYLTSQMELDAVVKATDIPRLFLINAGPVPPNPAELLGSEKMGNAIERLKELFDFVLFDSPPMLSVSDAMMLGPKIDGVILVVWGGRTARHTLKQAKERLDSLKIKCLGVIINNLNIQEHDYYYRYHYYHYYGEGKGTEKGL
ncbi:MAG: polysaccharide biosynthesis tyrosine autokinase [Candidatus Aminicenantales bacterium]